MERFNSGLVPTLVKELVREPITKGESAELAGKIVGVGATDKNRHHAQPSATQDANTAGDIPVPALGSWVLPRVQNINEGRGAQYFQR